MILNFSYIWQAGVKRDQKIFRSWPWVSSIASFSATRTLFLVPFDPRIPAFAFISILVINTFRILTQEDSLSPISSREIQRNRFSLQSDPLCGLVPLNAGGDCELDCVLHPRFSMVYYDPTCLRDCDQYPKCFHELYKDFRRQGRVGIWYDFITQDLMKVDFWFLSCATSEVRRSVWRELGRWVVRLASLTLSLHGGG